MNTTTPKKLNREDIARQFVTVQLANQLPPEALQAALDSATLWKGLRAEVAVYADFQNAVTIRPDDVAAMMPPGYFAALPDEQRKKLRKAIRDEDTARRRALRELQLLIDLQCQSVAAGSEAFQAAYEKRLNEYLTEEVTA